MNDEEVAFRIVRLYFEEVARLGFKRSLDLDQMINAYFYTLKKLKGKDAALKALAQKVLDSEKAKQTKPVENSKVTTTTTTVTTEKSAPVVVKEVIEKK